MKLGVSTIRNQAGKVVVALTAEAQGKAGVLDEVNLAIAIERSLGLENFVIPLLLEAMPFVNVRANLARKNIINFSDGWAAGLARLLEVLRRDNFPKGEPDPRNHAASIALERMRPRVLVSNEPEPVLLNVVNAVALPSRISFYELPSIQQSDISGHVSQLGLPAFRYQRLIGAFDADGALTERDSVLSLRCFTTTSSFLSEGIADLPGITRRDARNMVSSLLRQLWNAKAAGAGLIAYPLASQRLAWFVPTNLIPNDQVTFVDLSGTRRRKKLAGRSERKSVSGILRLISDPR